MITPADEDSAYRAAQNDLYRNISVRTQAANELLPIFSDDFLTPIGLPSDTTYFNKLAELTFNIDNLTSFYSSNGLPIPDNLFGLNPLGALNGLNPLEALNGLNPLEALNGLNPLGALNGINPLGALNGINPLGALNGINPLGNLGILNSFEAFNSLNVLNDLNPFASALNPFNNYLQTVQQSLLNCNLPPLPGADLLPSAESLTNLVNIDIFDSILKKVSSLPKIGMPTSTNIVSAILTIVQSTLSTLVGPFAGYLQAISACVKKF
jgi:hypothetical protein